MQDLQPNQRAINRFIGELSCNWDTHETLEIRCIRENYKPHTTRFAQHAFDEAVEHIVSMNRTHNIYACVNPVPDTTRGSAKNEHIKRAYFAFVDGDELGAADRARECDWFDVTMEVITCASTASGNAYLFLPLMRLIGRNGQLYLRQST